MKENTIKINGDDVRIGDAIERWKNAEISQVCIDYRLEMNEMFQNSYEDFAFVHSQNCMC